ncbi:GntR family transcriptional regulator [Roseibium sp.]|uniref:GntR family transcriptional regulator n=1 Tax=Roseibium sp. TaxID=1936156 RepID=UPI003263565A
MSQGPQTESKHAHALEALRRSICLATPDEDMVLHETALTAEFGMSRTPIRQILQRLAYERLVETRSGVGTAVVPLRPENRARDALVHKGILEAVLLLDLPKLSITQHSDILAISGLASLAGEDDRDLQYDIRSRLHALMSALIPDPILRDAFSASYWRIVRWQMSDLAADAPAAAEALRGLVRHLASYEAQNSIDLFNRVIEAEKLQGSC